MTDATVIHPSARIAFGSGKCATCQHWLPVEQQGGLCRRFPPVPMVVGVNQGKQSAIANRPRPMEPVIMPFFPRTGAEDMCGEYAMKIAGSA